MKFASPFKLRRAGIVGMNRRNVVAIGQNNARKLYPLVDDKLKTKLILEKAGITAPLLLGAVRTQGNVRELGSFLNHHQSFVIKPANGSGGNGILVIDGREGSHFIKPNGSRVSLKSVECHAANTLSGLFSLGGRNDVAMIEEMVEFADTFDGFTYEGVPDIRIIVYRGYPIMAMTRLSTSNSDGKANLHQGAVGVGISIADGKALKAVQFGQPVTHHPDTKQELSAFAVPDWPDFINLASRCYDITKLGYLGVDIVLDRKKGPMILELNARPGLAIQIANGEGLQSRLDVIDQERRSQRSPSERSAFVIQTFSKN